jgi:ethanolamine utilization microcompartment shell protein EutL
MNDSVTDFARLRGYLATVASGLGVGLESSTLDIDAPVSAYLAVDHKAAAYPERDVALLWDERGGWSIAVETHSGEDLIVLAAMDAAEVAPPADDVVAFVEQHCVARQGLSSVA